MDNQNMDVEILLEIVKAIETLRGSKVSLASILKTELDTNVLWSSRRDTDIGELRELIGGWGVLPNQDILQGLKDWRDGRHAFVNGLNWKLMRPYARIDEKAQPPRNFDHLMQYFRGQCFFDEIGHHLTCLFFFVSLIQFYCGIIKIWPRVSKAASGPFPCASELIVYLYDFKDRDGETIVENSVLQAIVQDISSRITIGAASDTV